MKQSTSVKAVLDTRYEKQSSTTYPVRIRVTHNRVQKYFKTDFSLSEKEWEKMNGGRPDDLKETLFELRDIERKAIKIVEKMPVFSFDAFAKKFFNQQDTSSVKGAFDKYISELRASGQIGTAIAYECSRESLNKFRADTLLKEITPEFLASYEQYMTGSSPTTVSMYLRCLRCLINKSIAAGDLSQEFYPFGRYKYQLPQARNVKKALSISEIGLINSYTGKYERSKDFWMFMYLACGMNAKDFCLLKYSNIQGDKIVYHRSKTIRTKRTREAISIPLNEDINRVVNKYGQGCKPDSYIFPILSEGLSPEREKQLIQQFTHVVNDHMKEVAKELKIERPCSTYYARHSFASVLKRSGVSTEMISELLDHGDIKTTKNYLAGFEDDAIKEKLKVLTAFKETTPLAKIVNL